MVRAAVGLLGDSVEAVSTSAAQCLARLRAASADEFAGHVRALPPALRTAYEAFEQGGPDKDEEEDAAKPLEYGFVRASLMTKLTSANKADWQSRAKAIAALQTELRELSADQAAQASRRRPPAPPPPRPSPHTPRPPQVVRHLAPLCSFLCTLLDDTNFKISLTSLQARHHPATRHPPRSPGRPRPPLRLIALQMISDVLDRFADSMATTLDGASAAAIVGRLMEKFADNKIVIRQQNLKVMKKLISSLSPAVVLPPLLTYTSHDNSHIREQAVNVVIQTLLASPSQPTELYRKAMSAMSAALDDVKPKVQSVALEACAVLRRRRDPPSTRCSASAASPKKVARIGAARAPGARGAPALGRRAGRVHRSARPPEAAGRCVARLVGAADDWRGGGTGGGGDDFELGDDRRRAAHRDITGGARSLPWDVGAMGAPRSGARAASPTDLRSRRSRGCSRRATEGMVGAAATAREDRQTDGAVPPGPLRPLPRRPPAPTARLGAGSPLREIERARRRRCDVVPGAAGA